MQLHLYVLVSWQRIRSRLKAFLKDNALVVEDKPTILKWIKTLSDKADTERKKGNPAPSYAVRYPPNPMSMSARASLQTKMKP